MPTITVATTAALAAYNDLALADFSTALVTGTGNTYGLHRESSLSPTNGSGTPGANDQVVKSYGPGNWILLPAGASGNAAPFIASRQNVLPQTISIFDPRWSGGADPTGATDSSAGFQAALTALSGTGIALYVPAGTYKIASPVLVPSNSHIIMSESTTMVAAMATGPVTNAIFYCNRVDGTSTTLSANAAPGSLTVQVTADVQVVGGWVFLYPNIANGSLRAKPYQIKAKSGTGPYTYTLDRPIKYAFSSGDFCQQETLNFNIRIDGNGALFTGTAQRYMELIGCVRSYVRDIRADDSGGSFIPDYAFSFDISPYDCEFRNIKINGAATCIGCLAIEGGENCRIIDCVVTNSLNSGYVILNAINTEIVNCAASNCVDFGIQAAQDGGNLGSMETKVIGGDYTKNAQAGVVFVGGQSNSAMGASFDSNNYGLYVGDGVSTTETTVIGCTFRQNTQGIVTDSVTSGTTVSGCNFDMTSAGTYGIDASGPIDVDSCYFNVTYASASAAIQAHSSGLMSFRGCQISIAGAGTSAIGILVVAGRANVSQCRVTLGTNQYAFICSNSGTVLSIQDSDTVGAGFVGVYVNDNTTFRQGHGCNFDSCTYKVYLNSSAANWNRGSVTANGTTPVAVAFPDFRSTDRVWLTPTGAAPTAFVSAKTVGMGFSVTATAGDTQTYDWMIE